MKNPPCWESTTPEIVVYRPSWRKTFVRSDAKMQKEPETHRPVESAAAVEIEFGGLWQLFLDDFHRLP
jgi:hypothetical protein